RSGIWRKAYALGAEVVLPAEHRYRTTRMKGEVLDEWPIFTTLVDADKVINVPVAKHHNLAKYTAAMKNWYGVLGGPRNRLHQNIDTSIADLATSMRPSLVVVDAMRVLMRNGPQGGNIYDANDTYTIIASADQVAADALDAPPAPAEAAAPPPITKVAPDGGGAAAAPARPAKKQKIDPKLPGSGIPARKSIRVLKWARRFAQLFFFALFMYFLFQTGF